MEVFAQFISNTLPRFTQISVVMICSSLSDRNDKFSIRAVMTAVNRITAL